MKKIYLSIALVSLIGCWLVLRHGTLPQSADVIDASSTVKARTNASVNRPTLKRPQMNASGTGDSSIPREGVIHNDQDESAALKAFLDTVTKLPVGDVSQQEILRLTVQFARSHPRTVFSSQDTLIQVLPANCWVNLIHEAASELAKDPSHAPLNDIYRSLSATETGLAAFLSGLKEESRLPLLDRILSDTSSPFSTLIQKRSFLKLCSLYPDKLAQVFGSSREERIRSYAAATIVEEAFRRDKVASFEVLDHLPPDVVPDAQVAFLRSFISHDMNAALSWVNQVEDQPTRDRFLDRTMASISAVDLNAAKRWAESIVDQQIRTKNLQMLARMEARRNNPR